MPISWDRKRYNWTPNKEDVKVGSVDEAHQIRRPKKLVNIDKEYPEWSVTLQLRKN